MIIIIKMIALKFIMGSAKSCADVTACLSSLVCIAGLFLCALMRYIVFMGVLFYA